MGISWQQLLIILLIALLIFGAKKLRNIGSDLGAAVRGFKKSLGEGESEQERKGLDLKGPDADFDTEHQARKTHTGNDKDV